MEDGTVDGAGSGAMVSMRGKWLQYTGLARVAGWETGRGLTSVLAVTMHHMGLCRCVVDDSTVLTIQVGEGGRSRQVEGMCSLTHTSPNIIHARVRQRSTKWWDVMAAPTALHVDRFERVFGQYMRWWTMNMINISWWKVTRGGGE